MSSKPTASVDTTSALRLLSYQFDERGNPLPIDPSGVWIITARDLAGSTLEDRLSQWTSEYNKIVAEGGDASSLLLSYKDMSEYYLEEFSRDLHTLEDYFRYTGKYDTLERDSELAAMTFFSTVLSASEEDDREALSKLATQYNQYYKNTRTAINGASFRPRMKTVLDAFEDKQALAEIKYNEVMRDQQMLEEEDALVVQARRVINLKTVAIARLEGELLKPYQAERLFSLLLLDERAPLAACLVEGSPHYKTFVHEPTHKTTIQEETLREYIVEILLVEDDSTRLISVNALDSTVTVERESDLSVFVSLFNSSVSVSANNVRETNYSFSLEDIGVHLEAFYQFLLLDKLYGKFLYTPDDILRDDQTSRPVVVRYNRYPIIDTELRRERHLRLQMSLTHTAAVGGGIMKAIVFTGNNLTIDEGQYAEWIIARALAAYKRKETDILSSIKRAWDYEVPLWSLDDLDNISALQLLKPSVFKDEYLASCVRKQPRLITKAEYDSQTDEWRRDHAAVVTESPDDDNPIYISCADTKGARYVVDRPKSKSLKTPNMIVPCCSATRDASKNERGFINSRRQLGVGDRGYLLGVGHLFGLKDAEKKGVTGVERRGIAQGRRSFLTAVATVLSQSGEGITTTPQGLLDYIIRKRGELSIAPFLQSMWRYSEEEVLDYLTRDADSDLVSDGIALNLGYNIFILEEQDEKYRLRAPRYNFAYYRPHYSDRMCIVIYRYSSREGVSYEPVVALKSMVSTSYVWLHSVTTSERCREMFGNNVTELVDARGNHMPIESAPYDSNYEYTGMTQVIDEYGKSRGVVIDGVALYFASPRAPLDYAYTRSVDEEDNLVNYFMLVEGESPLEESFSNVVLGDKLIGLPVSATLIPGTKTELTYNGDLVRRYDNATRTRSYILQLTNWLYALSREEPDDFMGYVTISSDVKYDFGSLYSDLTVAKDFAGAMELLESTGFTARYGDKLLVVLPSEIVFKGVYEMLLMERRTRKTDYAELPQRLVGLSTDRVQSKIVNGEYKTTLTLSDSNGYARWLASQRLSSYTNVTNLALESVQEYKYPYIFVSRSEQGTDRWLVQNVSQGQHERALMCVMTWLTTGVNKGYYTPALSPKGTKRALAYTVVRSWDSSGVLVPDTSPVKDGNVLNILVYPSATVSGKIIRGSYAALLRLDESA